LSATLGAGRFFRWFAGPGHGDQQLVSDCGNAGIRIKPGQHPIRKFILKSYIPHVVSTPHYVLINALYFIVLLKLIHQGAMIFPSPGLEVV